MAPYFLTATALSLLPAFQIECQEPSTTIPPISGPRKRKGTKRLEKENVSKAEELTTPLHPVEYRRTLSNIRLVGVPFPSIKSNRPRELSSLLPFAQEPQQSSGTRTTMEIVRDASHSVKASMPGYLPSISSDPGDLVSSFRLPYNRQSQLIVLRLKGFENDAALFHALHYLYRQTRGWRRYFGTVTGIHYVKFGLRGTRSIVVKTPDIPPTDRSDYKYQPRPAITIPPISPQYLAHLLYYPDCIEPDQDLIFRSLPKLVDADQSVNIASGSDRGPQEGWGLEFVEGYNFSAIAIVILSSFVFGVMIALWLFVSGRFSVQEAFGVASLSITLVSACFTVLLQMDRPMTQSRNYPITIAQKVDAYHIQHDGCLAFLVRSIRKAYAHWHNLLQLIGYWILVLLQTRTLTFKDGQCQSCGISLVRYTHDTNGHVSATTGRSVQHPVDQRSNAGGDGDPSDISNGGDRQTSDRRTGRVPGSGNEHPNSQHTDSDRDESDDESDDESEDDSDGGSIDDSEDSDLESAELYLHILLATGLRGKMQVPIKVTQFSNDYHLFVHLNTVYRKRRGHWNALWYVKSVRPVKYRLRDQSNVHIFYDPDNLASTMPDLHNRPPKYEFSYQPPEPVPDPPLLFAEELTHTFHHPYSRVWTSSNATVYSKEFYNRLPKHQGRLRCLINDGIVYGYGIEFVEVFNFKFFMYCELFILLCVFIVVGLYAGIARDKAKSGTSLGIGAFMFTLGQFLFAVILGLGEKLEAWKY